MAISCTWVCVTSSVPADVAFHSKPLAYTLSTSAWPTPCTQDIEELPRLLVL